MKSKTMRAAVAGGIVWGAALFLSTLANLYAGYGTVFLNWVASIYPGYSITLVGSVVGFVYGFLDVFVGVYIIVWVYDWLGRYAK